MRITIATIGKLVSKSPESAIISEYIKRIPWKIEIKEFEEKSKLTPQYLKEKEAEMLLSCCKDHYIIALDERGAKFNSTEFANLFEEYQVKNINKVAFVIGGAFGHGKLIEEKANFKFSLSDLTFPHMFARVILVEQLYRAFTINSGHPYHK